MIWHNYRFKHSGGEEDSIAQSIIFSIIMLFTTCLQASHATCPLKFLKERNLISLD
jgi:hypothetical protein